jgi:lysophospholipase L1-like esterase
MADRRRDRLSLSAALAGGACVVVVSGMLTAVLWRPALPQPRTATAETYEVASTALLPPPHRRDNDRIPAAGDVPPAAAPATPPVVEASNAPLNTTTTLPGEPPSNRPSPQLSGGFQAKRGLVILQIGDSHTAADYFSGEVRARLQQRYGNGGVGYIVAGKPTVGVRSNTLKIAASPGWTYHAIQHSDNVPEFWLSGFNAVASAAGESLTFTSDTLVPFDSIEIEALRQPGGGAIDISLDGAVKSSADLSGNSTEPVVLRLRPDGVPSDRVRQIEIKTRGAGAVSIASVGIYQKQSGVSYNNIGYPGATVDLVNKFDDKLMADGLRRLDPQIVVLAFGTNEAAKPNLDAARYGQNYEKAIGKITAALPNARIVLIGPPDGAERPPHCAGKGSSDVCHPAAPSGGANASSAEPADCDWHTIAHLDMVRDVERGIAERHGYTYWNWASIMPGQCASKEWVSASPPLMTPDHVHFTPTGYNKGAAKFVEALIPVIEKLQVRPNIAASN